MIVKITQDKINNGIRCDADFCPIALALQEHDPNAWVGMGQLHVNDRIYPIPHEAKRFIQAFDENDYTEPFTFELPDG